MESRQLIMTPGPTNIPTRVANAMLRPMINHRGSEFRDLHARIVENAKRVFQTKSDLFVLTASGTGAVECAIDNICSPNARIIVPVNGDFSQRFLNAVNLLGGRGIEIPVEWGDAATLLQIKEALERNSPVTAVGIVINETSTGALTPHIKEIGRLCREHGALLIVDAVSILGGISIPVDEWGIDICFAGSQKCLMTPPGISLISVNNRAWEVIKKTARPYYFDLLVCKRFWDEHNETPYTPAIPLFYALDEALQIIMEEGLEACFRRHETCSKAMYSAVEAMGLDLYARSKVRSPTVLAAKYPKGIEDRNFRSALDKRYRVVVAGGIGKNQGIVFRMGIMGMVSQPEIMTTILAIECVLAEQGHKLKLGDGIAAAGDVFNKAR